MISNGSQRTHVVVYLLRHLDISDTIWEVIHGY